MNPLFTYSPVPALEPLEGCDWADTMILNPAIFKDPDTHVLHMLFRSTGPWSHKRLPGSPLDPYPIFLGYARSEDMGKTWEADFERPALAPALAYEPEQLMIRDDLGNMVVNYANGCVEDPRIFQTDGQWFLSVACRMFPPGPYWRQDVRGKTQTANAPLWSQQENNPFGRAAWKNETVSVLFRVSLPHLIARDYDNAFAYVCPLTDPEVDDNRDVFLFPEKMMIQGKRQYVLLHRPHHPDKFAAGAGYTSPSIMLAAAEDIRDLATDKATHHFLATGIFDWEQERIGASWAPLKLDNGDWLLQYHGKTYPGYGYTQSFMILRERSDDFPEIIHRCPDRLMYAQQPWEMPDRFPCPCLFTTGGIVVDDSLIISYGAADQRVGIAWGSLSEIVAHVRQFGPSGQLIDK